MRIFSLSLPLSTSFSLSLTHTQTHTNKMTILVIARSDIVQAQHTVLSSTDKQEAVGMFVYSSVGTGADVCCDYSDNMVNQLSFQSYRYTQQFAVVFHVLVPSLSTQNKVYNSL